MDSVQEPQSIKAGTSKQKAVMHLKTIKQASNTLDYWHLSEEFSDSSEQVEEEKILLLAIQAHSAALNKIQRFIQTCGARKY